MLRPIEATNSIAYYLLYTTSLDAYPEMNIQWHLLADQYTVGELNCGIYVWKTGFNDA